MSNNFLTSLNQNIHNCFNQKNYLLINEYLNQIKKKSKLFQNGIISIENPEQICSFIPESKILKNKTSSVEKNFSEKENKNSINETPKNIIPYSSKVNNFYSSIKQLNEEYYNINQYYFNPFPQIELKDPFQNIILENCELQVKNKPIYVMEYSNDIFRFLKNFQNINQPKLSENLLENQKNISKSKRALLINNLIYIHEKFELIDETLYLCVNLIDRFLSDSNQKIKNDIEFLLLGITCLFIAGKYEEVEPPEITDYIYITKHIFSKEQIISMEYKILSSFNFNIIHISPLIFLDRLTFVSEMKNNQMIFLSKYILELSLFDPIFYKYNSLIKACSAVYLTRKFFKFSECWNDILKIHSGYDKKSFKKCAKDLCFMINNINKTNLKAIIHKYSTNEKCKVSLI
jgi:hypothetical protein